MAFKESPRFPDCISMGAQGGPAFNTSVVTISNGEESRNQNWSESRQEYDVSQAVKTESDYKLLNAFFRSVKGRKHPFRYKDWVDFKVNVDEGVVTELTSTTFQLVKKYVSGSDTDLREIKKPLAARFAIYVSDVAMGPGEFTLDATTGVVTTTAPQVAANISWSGEFDVPVRFDTDKLNAEIIDRNKTHGLLLAWSSIPLVEVKNE